MIALPFEYASLRARERRVTLAMSHDDACSLVQGLRRIGYGEALSKNSDSPMAVLLNDLSLISTWPCLTSYREN